MKRHKFSDDKAIPAWLSAFQLQEIMTCISCSQRRWVNFLNAPWMLCTLV